MGLTLPTDPGPSLWATCPGVNYLTVWDSVSLPVTLGINFLLTVGTLVEDPWEEIPE